ncbi:MAG TPA: FtsX-like permease family protein [Solirubrobacteraceae bacterium]|nr:FtsX-like permease family protein [Solirubrobacteraceae bacterium]
MRPGNALRLYYVRLRARLAQELLAVLGIAAGVALLFASQVASTSLQSSVGQLASGVDGNATLQLLARAPEGFPQSALARVRHTPGVRFAAPLLETGANAIGPQGSAAIQLIGADESVSALRGRLVRDRSFAPFGGIEAIVLPAPLANTLGVVKFGQEATLQVAGRSVRVPLYSVLRRRQIGALVETPAALAPLSFVQEAAGLSGRLSRILVQPDRGAEARVRAALTRIAGTAANVESTGYDQRLFDQAATASSQSTSLFSVISALVGFLFAFNAMLLTVPQRRRLAADLRRDGYTPATVIGVLLLDAIGLGALGCVLGLALGQELSIHLFHSQPAFLSLAFAVGSQRTVTAQSVAIAVAGGMGAAIVAVLSPLRDVLARDPLAAIRPREDTEVLRGGGRLAAAGMLCLVAATVLLLRAPQAPMPAMVLLVLALLAQLPLALDRSLALLRRLAGLVVSPVGHVAAIELRACGARGVAIAATGAVAVFGSVAIDGAHQDLLSGLRHNAAEASASAKLWVAPAGSYNLLDTTPFQPRQAAALARLPGIRSVGLYRGSLLDYGDRRIRVLAPPPSSQPLPPGQLLSGSLPLAEARLRAGGWLAISKALAQSASLHLGDTVSLPTPTPVPLRVAAITTNLGWAPGAVELNAGDYARAWASEDVSAYAVTLQPGFSEQRAAGELRRALGPGSGLAVKSARRQAAEQTTLSRQALAQLTQIATLIPIVAVLAMAAAIGAMVWQRRPRLAKLKLEGIAHGELWGTILLESVVLLGVGCMAGAAFGLIGQRLADRALAQAVNFPVSLSLAAGPAIASIALVVAAALAILALPGYLASSVPASVALQD